MKRIFNFRLPLLCAAIFVVAILLSLSAIKIGLWILIIPICVGVISMIILMFFSKTRLIIILCFAIASLIIGSAIPLSIFKSRYIDQVVEGTYQVNARVCSVRIIDKNTYLLYFDSVNFDGNQKKYKLAVYTSDSNAKAIAIGDRLKFFADIENYDYTNGEMALEGLNYYCNFVSNFSFIKSEPTVFENIAAFIKNKIKSNAPNECDYLIALLLGDTSLIPQDELDNIRLSGIAHVFAVSGLHIGFLVIVLNLILSKIGLKRIKKTIVITILAFTYSGICGFSPSSIRALIMTAVLLLCNSFGEKYDLLNATSFSIIVSLIVNPFNIFSVGFVLSYGSVFSIALFEPVFSRLFSGLTPKINTAVSITCATQVGTLPLLFLYFNSSSVAVILLNMIAVPFVSLTYISTFIVTILSCILPFLSNILFLLPSTLAYIMSLPFLIINFSKLAVFLVPTTIIIVLYYTLIVMFSDKINVSDKIKIRGIVSTISLFIVYCL